MKALKKFSNDHENYYSGRDTDGQMKYYHRMGRHYFPITPLSDKHGKYFTLTLKNKDNKNYETVRWSVE